MSCCGNERQAWPQAENSGLRPELKAVNFEYTGRSALTVMGPLTGQRYRFGAPGTVLAVDARDAGFMMAVPHLKRMRGQG